MDSFLSMLVSLSRSIFSCGILFGGRCSHGSIRRDFFELILYVSLCLSFCSVLFTRWLLIGAYLLGDFGFPEYYLKICLLLGDLGGFHGEWFSRYFGGATS